MPIFPFHFTPLFTTSTPLAPVFQHFPQDTTENRTHHPLTFHPPSSRPFSGPKPYPLTLHEIFTQAQIHTHVAEFHKQHTHHVWPSFHPAIVVPAAPNPPLGDSAGSRDSGRFGQGLDPSLWSVRIQKGD